MMKKSLHILLLILVCTVLSNGRLFAQSNQYLHFDGMNDYTYLPNAASSLNGSNTISMAGWFYTDALVYGQGMMSIRGGGTGTGEMYVIQLSDGKLECRVNTSTGLKEYASPDHTVVAGTWQYIAWVFNATTVELYVDGALVGSSPASGVFESTDKPFTIGRCIASTFDFYFGGRADEVSLWNKALTAAEISDIMANELAGDEEGLVAYYKFNQGMPGADNSSITHLISSTGSSANSTLHNFALTGETSNFNGTLEDGYQAISFPSVPNKLISDEPFELAAVTTSGLPVTYEVISGPASVSGSTVTLSGSAGEVTIEASQPGNETFNPAESQSISFQVLDPDAVLAQASVTHPMSGNVAAPALIPVMISLKADIEYPEIFSVDDVSARVDGEAVELTHHGNGYFTGWWTPADYGSAVLEVKSVNNFGAESTETVNFTLVNSSSNTTVTAIDEAWVNLNVSTIIQESELPSHVGAYDRIIGKLNIDCPSGGCDPWDRVSHVEVQGKDGEWYEIIRYLTPYGVACDHEIDLTDFASLLSGKTTFRVTLGTQGNGFLYTLNLEYRAGIPEHPYSRVEKLWYNTYQFGDMGNLQPAEEINKNITPGTLAAKIKLVATGHGWGENNTGNAAEFKRNKHHIWVNGASTFEHDNWNICNPNPDGCSPQYGTWQYNRAGWCPGSIAQFFDYDMTPHLSSGDVSLKYILDESYVDYCHPNNPDCITGVTCADCHDGFNPHLVAASYFVSFGDHPTRLSIKDDQPVAAMVNLYPNPSNGQFFVEFSRAAPGGNIVVYDISGRSMKNVKIPFGSTKTEVQVSDIPAGIYLVTILLEDSKPLHRKLIIE